ncbi:MAG: deoxyguanosinetriphosphate triphosphohydrolase [Oscillospiraceae bacterium]|jgi:dGTPase|nr:deoxyguanosinetriphosphate triphosphohydrolase [Oscillospiraceae bacterium]
MEDKLALPRVLREELERNTLLPLAAFAESSRGRGTPETECDLRTCFQRDADRLTHSKSFRRLIHKTQVFLNPEGDHYRTRLTHTLEVSRIARTISRALRLNEDLTEAIAIGHDLGHTPFGHAGERALDAIMSEAGGFRHNEQSLRVVDRLEKGGRGLNLSYETRDGILKHTGQEKPETLEGRVVRVSDRAAYLNHDLDDALRAGIITAEDIPPEILCAFGESLSRRVDTVVRDVINESAETGEIAMSAGLRLAFEGFYSFMFENLYMNVRAKSEETKVFGILNGIFGYYVKSPQKLPDDYRAIADADGLARAVCDYVSGMTDSYAIAEYERLFVPDAWHIR